MPDVLIRSVPDADLEQLRSAAAERGLSLQAYLREAVHAQAAHLRRRTAVARAAERLRGRPGVPVEDRRAVLDAVDDAHGERAGRLGDRQQP